MSSDKSYAVEQRLNNLGMWSDANGIDRYTGSDGNTYSLGQCVVYNASPVSINSTTPITILTLNAIAGTIYRLAGLISATNGASGTLQPQTIRINQNGSCTLNPMRVTVRSANEGSVSSAAALGQTTAQGTDPSAARTPALSEIFTIEFAGIVVCTGTGTLTIDGRDVTSGSDVNWVANAYSFAELAAV